MSLETGLAGKVVIVTGAGAGIGRAPAVAFAKEKCRVAAWDIADANAAAVVEELKAVGGEAMFQKVDVASAESVNAAVAAVASAWGAVHVLVNNAGIVRDAQPVKWKDGAQTGMMSDEGFDQVVGVNLRGPFLCTRAVVPAMKRQGSGAILNIASVAGLVANPQLSGYNATKFGLMGFSEACMLELRHFGIKVAAICPGSTATDFGAACAAWCRASSSTRRRSTRRASTPSSIR